MVLQLSLQQRDSIVPRLTQALQYFGQLTLDSCGALAQTWLPVSEPDGQVLLQTKGMPYNIIGPGDMLALFRCMSCKYSFCADLRQMPLLGSPGRVFLSGETETSDNVQQCNASIYLRVRDAQACRVSSTVLMPVYADEDRSTAVAVLEVTQFNGRGVNYARIFQWARKYVEGVGLFMPASLETRSFEMQSHALSMKIFSMPSPSLHSILNSRALELPAPPSQAHEPAASSAAAPQPAARRSEPAAAAIASPRQAAKGSSAKPAVSSSSNGLASSLHEGDSENESKDESKPRPDDDLWEPKVAVTGGHSRNGGLTKEDLERHFRYGLKAAAVRLGVCNTTLKRACRKHGILKWPRREILRKEKADRKRSSTEAKAAAKVAESAEGAALASSKAPPPTPAPLPTPDFTGALRASMPQAPAPVGRSPFTDPVPQGQCSQVPLSIQEIARLMSDWPAPLPRDMDYQRLPELDGPPVIPIDLSPEPPQGTDNLSIDWLPGGADISDYTKWQELSPPPEGKRLLPGNVGVPSLSRNSSMGLDNLYGEGFHDVAPGSVGDWCLAALRASSQDHRPQGSGTQAVRAPVGVSQQHAVKELLPIKDEWMLSDAKQDPVWGL